jgi:hypothetical protein
MASDDGFAEVPGTDGGLLKKILREGTGDENPQSGNDVSVHYVGTLTSTGEKFDSSRDRQYDFRLAVLSSMRRNILLALTYTVFQRRNFRLYCRYWECYQRMGCRNPHNEKRCQHKQPLLRCVPWPFYSIQNILGLLLCFSELSWNDWFLFEIAVVSVLNPFDFQESSAFYGAEQITLTAIVAHRLRFQAVRALILRCAKG